MINFRGFGFAQDSAKDGAKKAADTAKDAASKSADTVNSAAYGDDFCYLLIIIITTICIVL